MSTNDNASAPVFYPSAVLRSNVPLPPRRAGAVGRSAERYNALMTAFPLDKMAVGQSFVVPADHPLLCHLPLTSDKPTVGARASAIMSAFAGWYRNRGKCRDKSFATRLLDPNTLGVWRVK